MPCWYLHQQDWGLLPWVVMVGMEAERYYLMDLVLGELNQCHCQFHLQD